MQELIESRIARKRKQLNFMRSFTNQTTRYKMTLKYTTPSKFNTEIIIPPNRNTVIIIPPNRNTVIITLLKIFAALIFIGSLYNNCITYCGSLNNKRVSGGRECV